jgi:hypothetical protein
LAAGIAVGLYLRSARAAAEPLPQRQAAVLALSPAESDQLRQQHARFFSLSSDDQLRLRALHEQLDAADDGEELRQTLRRYHDWLKTLQPADRAELIELADKPDRRLARVEELQSLSAEDQRVVRDWLRDCLKARVPERILSQWNEGSLLFFARQLLAERGPGRGGWPGPGFTTLTEADLQKLAGQLSPLRREALQREKSLSGKRRVISAWLQRTRGPGEIRPPATTEDELVRHFAETMSEEDRRRLVALPLEERNRQLRDDYFRSRFGDREKRPGGGPPGSGKPTRPRDDDSKKSPANGKKTS